uniref:COMM domain-containing protein n=1 Tax=Pygocentrus nattereri TaxID=42514 RepID=A0AAR2JX21_PYGNA
MAAIAKETQSIKEAVGHINQVDANKFGRLLSRILQKLHLKGERSFSEDEEQKLQTALAMEKQALHLVLETTSFLLEQAVYHNIKPASFKQQLENIHIAPDKAEAFCQAWATAGPDVVEKIRQRIFAPKKLDHIGWQLNLQMAQSSQAKLKAPHAVLDLGVKEEDESENLGILMSCDGGYPVILHRKDVPNSRALFSSLFLRCCSVWHVLSSFTPGTLFGAHPLCCMNVSFSWPLVNLPLASLHHNESYIMVLMLTLAL